MEQTPPSSSNLYSYKPRAPLSEAQRMQHRQIVEEQRETWRLRRIEMQRANRTRGPSVDGVIWKRNIPEPQSKIPILSILRFKFKPKVEILDTSSIPRKLWNSSLQYIGSIPGCLSIEWGQAMGDSTSMLCIITWDGVISWRDFQHSFGFGLVAALLAANLSDDCMKLHSADVIELGQRESILEEVSFIFRSGLPPKVKLKFEGDWADLVASFSERDLLCTRSDWLEQRVSTSRNPTAEQIAASQVPLVFTGILVWNAGSYDSQLSARPCTSLRENILLNHECHFTQIAVGRIQERLSKDDGPQSLLLAPVPTSLASILKIELPRHFGTDHGVFHNTDREADRSIGEARQRRRLFPAPQGSFYPQGMFSQDEIGLITHMLHRRHHDYDKNFIVDVLWLQFIPNSIPLLTNNLYEKENFKNTLHSLHSEISLLSGCTANFGAWDVEEETTAAFLTVWEDPITRSTSIRQYHQIVEAFAVSSSTCLAAPPRHQILPLCHRTHFNLITYLELIKFSAPSGELNRQLSEHAYMDFERTTKQIRGGIPTACRPLDTGGWLPADVSEPSDHVGMQQFTGALDWESPAARQEWYRDLLQGALSYERFGHKLDRLKILAVGGVESRFLSLFRL